MYDEIITLLTIKENAEGINVVEEITEETELFADVKSVGMKETYEALSVGLKPELTFEIADYLDYNGQEAIKYDDERYKVIRTYRKDKKLEIVVTR